MATAKVAITLDEDLLEEVDGLVSKGTFSNRSQAICEAVREKIGRLMKRRLIEEVKKLNVTEEQKLADEWMSGESHWPEY